MSAITHVPDEVAAYLAAVRDTLSDVPAVERDDLLNEVEASLREAADEGGSIGDRLGSPQDFAAELRAAAGLQRAPSRHSRATIVRWVRSVLGRRWIVAVGRFCRELAPIWWVVRAYVGIAALTLATHSGWSTRFPAVPRLGSAQAGVAAVVLAVAASIAFGLRTRRGHSNLRVGALGLNLVCVALAVPVLGHLDRGAIAPTVIVTVPAPFAAPGLVYNGVPIQNIYPYGRNGKLLHDVLLYDGAGNPLNLESSAPDPNRRVLTTTANTRVFNSFPIRYFEPGTVRVAHPNAGPPVKTPTILPAP